MSKQSPDKAGEVLRRNDALAVQFGAAMHVLPVQLGRVAAGVVRGRQWSVGSAQPRQGELFVFLVIFTGLFTVVGLMKKLKEIEVRVIVATGMNQ